MSFQASRIQRSSSQRKTLRLVLSTLARCADAYRDPRKCQRSVRMRPPLMGRPQENETSPLGEAPRKQDLPCWEGSKETRPSLLGRPCRWFSSALLVRRYSSYSLSYVETIRRKHEERVNGRCGFDAAEAIVREHILGRAVAEWSWGTGL